MNQLQETEDGRYIYGAIDGRTGEPFTLEPTLNWLTGAPIEAKHVDDILYFQLIDGRFAQRVLVNGEINAAWIMTPDGSDCYPLLKKFHDNIVAYGGAEINLRLVINPVGNNRYYYFSKTPVFTNSHFTVEWRGAEWQVPPGQAGLELLRSGTREEYTLINPRIRASGKAVDGMVMSDDPAYLALLTRAGYTPEETNLFGQHYDMPGPGEPARLVKSIIPEYGYNFHGIRFTCPVKIIHPSISGFSGAAIRNFGPAIAAGTNTSLSAISGGGEISNCAAGYVVNGDDANACTISGGVFSVRDCELNAVYDNSGLGNYYEGLHASTNKWGNYLAVGPSNHSLFLQCYSEGDNTKNRYLGYAMRIGGIQPNPVLTSQFAFVQEGNYTDYMRMGGLRVLGEVNYGADTYFGLQQTLAAEAPYLLQHWHIGGEAINQQLLEIFAANATRINGNRADVPSVAMRTAYIGEIYHVTANSLSSQDYYLRNVKWKPGYLITNSAYDGTNAPAWRCTGFGLWPGQTYAELEGLTVQSFSSQWLKMSGVSRFVKVGDKFVINGTLGNDRTVIRTGVDTDGNTLLEVNASITVGAGSTLVYPTATFKAQ